jgi:transposase
MEAQSEKIKDSQEQSEPGGATKRKRGETPPQQIRKAKKATRRRFSAEEKIRIVMEGIRAEEPVSVLCRREGIHTTVYYRWLKGFLEAGKQRLRGDTLREAGQDEVRALRDENARLKQLVAEYALESMALKKSVLGEQ